MITRLRTNERKALGLIYYNADEVRGRKLELDPFPRENGVDICLLSEVVSFANHMCHRMDHPTRRGSTAIFVRSA